MVRQTRYAKVSISLAVSEADWREARGDDLEWCEACGSDHGGREPDVRRYDCEACERRTVFGAEDAGDWIANGWLELGEPPTKRTEEDFNTASDADLGAHARRARQ